MLATKKNHREIEHVLDVAKIYGASKFEILDYQCVGKANNTLDLTPSDRDRLAERLCLLWKDIIANKERISLLYKNPNFYRAMKKTVSHVKTVNLFGAAYPEEAVHLFTYSKRMKEGIFQYKIPSVLLPPVVKQGFLVRLLM
jgi:MoaA/NifB/PqqE/SkfB family radical SAM enzyme